MELKWVDIEELEGWPRNPKEHSIPAISRSFKRFGFTAPILVDDRMNKIIAGHGRIKVLKGMRDREEPAPERIKVENGKWFAPVIVGVNFADAKEVEGYIVADNKTTELGGWDNEMLADILEELMESDQDLAEATGMKLSHIEQIIDDMNPDALELGDNGSSKSKNLHKCPKCGFRFEVK